MSYDWQDLKCTEGAASRKASLVEGGLRSSRTFSVQFTDAFLKSGRDNGRALDPEWLSMNFYDPETGFLVEFGDPHPVYASSTVKEVRVEPQGRGCNVEVTYELPDILQKMDMNGELWQFDWTSTQQHITSTVFTQLHYPATANFGLVIGADGEEVKGCDVQRPTGTLKLSKKLNVYPSASFLRNCVEAIGCTNSTAFAQGAILPGEALLVSCNPMRIQKGLYILELNFLIAKQQATATVPLWDGSNVAVDYRPWDVIWFRHQGKVTTPQGGGGKKRQMGIESIHIARVYDEMNFASTFSLMGPTYND